MNHTEDISRTAEALPWYGLRVKSKFESVASTGLRGKGYDTFVPVYRMRRRWSDRVKEIEAPLFPGYVFCRLNAARRLPVLTTPGVVGIVGIGKAPAPIPDREIEVIRTVVASGLPARPWPFSRAGDRVTVEAGPLRGVEGVVTNADDGRRLIVSVTLLQRAVSVELDPAWVRTVHQPAGWTGIENL